MLALSLMGAFNRAALRNGPLIMDSPLARLDETNREKLLRNPTAFSNQLFLFVHSGEISLSQEDSFYLKILENLNSDGLLSKQFEIVQDPTTEISKINLI